MTKQIRDTLIDSPQVDGKNCTLIKTQTQNDLISYCTLHLSDTLVLKRANCLCGVEQAKGH